MSKNELQHFFSNGTRQAEKEGRHHTALTNVFGFKMVWGFFSINFQKAEIDVLREEVEFRLLLTLECTDATPDIHRVSYFTHFFLLLSVIYFSIFQV